MNKECRYIINDEKEKMAIMWTELENFSYLFSIQIYLKKSLFETNKLLTEINCIKLIEFTSFYVLNGIIKCMEMKGVELTSLICIFAIHSGNAELIRYLDDNHVSPQKNKYEWILEDSI